jgi:GTP-binding protein
MANIVAIVGRPNVGKSTLFNRLVEERKAIMDNFSGVTRDRHYGYAEWTGHGFTVVDTGGYVSDSEDIFESEIRKQIKMAIEEANLILFMVDSETGLTGQDSEFANVLRTVNKEVLIVANKADNYERHMMASEFYSLGFEKIFPVSSVSGSGTGELLDEVVECLDFSEPEGEVNEIPRIAILGRPNVGKSSFLNMLMGTERTIVTDIAGTTRDSIDTHYTMFGKNIILTDTAGVRKKSKVKDNIEFYSVMRSLQALQNSDICIIMLDASQGIESQDLHLIALAHKYRKGLVIMVNKWDLVEKETSTMDKYKKVIQERLGPMDYIPIIFASVIQKKRVMQVLDKAIEVYDNKNSKIPTSQLNSVVLEAIEKYPPPAIKGKYVKIKYVTQLPTNNPTFAFFCNFPQYIKEPYERYLENKMRNSFQLEGVPIKLVFRKK